MLSSAKTKNDSRAAVLILPRRPSNYLITCQRFLFDLELLELDYLENPRDIHTLFYLGER